MIEFTDEANQVHRIGVIDIPAFYLDFEAYRNGNKNYRSTTRDVQRLIDELVAEGVEGLVIDLRDNGGGSLQEANQLTRAVHRIRPDGADSVLGEPGVARRKASQVQLL